MTMYGAETEELDRIAAELIRVADDLDGGANGLTRAVSTVAWFGESAIGFVADWTGLKIPRLFMTTQFLRDAAVELSHQAREQRLASDRVGGEYVKDAGWNTREKIATGLDGQLDGIRHQSPEAQRAWWESLTDAEREALIRNRSEEVMVIDGLPQDDRAAAQAVWETEVAPGMVVVSRSTLKAEAMVNIRGVNVFAGLDGKITRYGDGSIDLEIGVGVGAGLGLSEELSVALKGRDGMRLHFDSQDEYDEFMHDLILAETSGPVMRGKRMADLFAEHVSEIEAVNHGVEASVKAGELSGSVTAKGELNFSDKTVTGSIEGKGRAGNIASVDARLKMTAGLDGMPKKITLEMEGGIAPLGMGIRDLGAKAPVSFDAYLAKTGTAKFELDLTDPDVAIAAPAIIAAAQRGDIKGAYEQLARVGDRVRIQLSTGNKAAGNIKVGGKGGYGKVDGDHTTYDKTWIRPPGGELMEVSP